jgi:transcription elongation GreA/GreB family factor
LLDERLVEIITKREMDVLAEIDEVSVIKPIAVALVKPLINV